MEQKIFASSLSRQKQWEKALEEIICDAKKQLGDKSCDAAVFFVSETYPGLDPALFSRTLKDALGCRYLLGCNSSGVIGNDKEVEMEPAISLMAMHLPGVKFFPFALSPDQLESAANGTELIQSLDIYPSDRPHFICLADPMSCDITHFLAAFNEGYKGLPVIGGLASGTVLGIPNWLALGTEIHTEGMVGLALVGPVEFETIVSQGCRPVGKPYVITKAEENVLYELAGRPALEVVREVVEALSAADQKLAESSLFTGIVMNERQSTFKRGDFLVRNIMGFDPDSGSLVIGSGLRVGQTLQFQLRDAGTSEEDLKTLLGRSVNGTKEPRGVLLVSCCGRGQGLYGKPDHDVRMIQSAKGPVPLAGFFANGEIGPIGEKNFVHGYTSSLVIIR